MNIVVGECLPGDCDYCLGLKCALCGESFLVAVSDCNHDNLQRHGWPDKAAHELVSTRSTAISNNHSFSGAETVSEQTQTLGKSPKSSSNVQFELFTNQGWKFKLCLQGEWLVSDKFYKSQIDCETAVFRLSRKLQVTLRGL